jgi:hypothetical protein
MIVVRVELHSAINGRVTELARMEIANDGQASVENPNRGDYAVRTLRGRSREQLDKRSTQRSGFVRNHARLAEHVWNLVAKALKALKYGEPECNSISTPPMVPTSSASREGSAS